MSLHVAVVGGGIVGCMTAMALTRLGCRVTIIERNVIAAQTSGESSWAGAGILFPLLPWFYKDEVNQLSLSGASAYPHICRELHETTGIDPECIQSGMVIAPPFDQAKALDWCTRFGVPVELKDDCLFLPQVHQVRNPRLLQSLKAWLIKHNVRLVEKTQLEPLPDCNYIDTWKANSGEDIKADAFVVTSGAWSFELLKNASTQLNIKPMRGQILLYQQPETFAEARLQHIVYKDGFYLVPRNDGYLLAGSTLEDVGFDTGVTDDAKREMQTKAESLWPALKSLQILQHWSGLRPGTPHNLPTISAHPHIRNLYLNTGHFRYGLTMAPSSAHIASALVCGQTPEISPEPFRLLA